MPAASDGGSGSSDIASQVAGIAAGQPSPSVPALINRIADFRSQSPSGTPTTGAVMQQVAALSARASGREIGFDFITSTVNVTGSAASTSTTVIPGSAHIFDGNPVFTEFYCGTVELPAVAGGSMNIALFEGSTLIAVLSTLQNTATSSFWLPVSLHYRFSPAAGSHTYSIKAWVSSTTGTPAIFAQSGSGNNVPAFLRFTRV